MCRFEEPTVYRLEWEPGPEGYVAMYIQDGAEYRLMLRINGEDIAGDVRLSGAKSSDGRSSGKVVGGRVIPAEPMYVILNVDMSLRWNFPSVEDPEEPGGICTGCHCAEGTAMQPPVLNANTLNSNSTALQPPVRLRQRAQDR